MALQDALKTLTTLKIEMEACIEIAIAHRDEGNLNTALDLLNDIQTLLLQMTSMREAGEHGLEPASQQETALQSLAAPPVVELPAELASQPPRPQPASASAVNIPPALELQPVVPAAAELFQRLNHLKTAMLDTLSAAENNMNNRHFDAARKPLNRTKVLVEQGLRNAGIIHAEDNLELFNLRQEVQQLLLQVVLLQRRCIQVTDQALLAPQQLEAHQAVVRPVALQQQVGDAHPHAGAFSDATDGLQYQLDQAIQQLQTTATTHPNPHILTKVNLLLEHITTKYQSPTQELIDAITATTDVLAGTITPDSYNNIANTVHGKSSPGMQALGVIMMALGALVAALAVALAPSILTIGIMAGVSGALVGSGYGFFAKGSQQGLSAMMSDIAKDIPERSQRATL